MKVAFRVDASNDIGIGHVMRCLTLADILMERGAEVQFLCSDHPGNMAALLRQRSIEVELLPRPAGANEFKNAADYSNWLGATQPEDAERTIRALRGQHLDWLIVDHYALDAEWESQLRPHANNVLAIDDLANRRHDCDVLVDQNYSSSAEDRYRGLLSAGGRAWLGPYFAMLRPEFRRARRSPRTRDGAVRRILIFFGGSDPLNLTGLAIEALCKPEFRSLQVDVVVGINNPHRHSLEESAGRRPHTSIYGPQLHLADLMAQADLSIGAGGVTTWERMCAGLPSIVVSIADNQRPACNSLAEAGLIFYPGHCDAIQFSDLVSSIRSVLAQPDAMAKMSIRNLLTVDGWGAARIVESMLPTGKDDLRLRPAGPDDLPEYFLWVNDPDVRSQSIHSQPVAFEDHKEWFAGKLAAPDSRLFVMVAGSLPVGQIRFDRYGNEERIDYSIDRCFRGRGWASRLASMGMSQLPLRCGMVFRADVKQNNRPSQNVFSRLGFSSNVSDHGNGVLVFRFDPRESGNGGV
jgi:UDP-2,4-diacetamido-2,4,6-trideoxy-beta-L-altropyranose hydrolase